MKTKLLAAALIAAALPTAAMAQRVPPASVVVIDTDRIYRECNACRAAQASLQAQVTTLQQRQQTLGQPIQTELQSIEAAARAAQNASGAARTTAEQQIQQRLQALRQQESTANQELQLLETNLRSTQAHVLQQINTRLNPIIQQVMTARGANLAVAVGATLAHAGGVNVTNDVLTQLNAQLPAVSVTPMPQAAAPAQPAQPQQPRPQGR
jgi:outer membrane protein